MGSESRHYPGSDLGYRGDYISPHKPLLPTPSLVRSPPPLLLPGRVKSPPPSLVKRGPRTPPLPLPSFDPSVPPPLVKGPRTPSPPLLNLHRPPPPPPLVGPRTPPPLQPRRGPRTPTGPRTPPLPSGPRTPSDGSPASDMSGRYDDYPSSRNRKHSPSSSRQRYVSPSPSSRRGGGYSPSPGRGRGDSPSGRRGYSPERGLRERRRSITPEGNDARGYTPEPRSPYGRTGRSPSPRYERSPGGGGGGKRRRTRGDEWEQPGHDSPAKRKKSRDRSKDRRKEEKKKKKDKDRDRNRSQSPSSRKRRRSPRSPVSSNDSPRYAKTFGTPATTIEEDLAKAKSLVKRDAKIHDTSLFAEMLKKKQLRDKLAQNRSRKEGEAIAAAPAAAVSSDTVDAAAHRGPPPLPPLQPSSGQSHLLPEDHRQNRRSGHQPPLPTRSEGRSAPPPEHAATDQRRLSVNGAKYRKGEQLLAQEQVEPNNRPKNSTPRPSKLPGPPGEREYNQQHVGATNIKTVLHCYRELFSFRV